MRRLRRCVYLPRAYRDSQRLDCRDSSAKNSGVQTIYPIGVSWLMVPWYNPREPPTDVTAIARETLENQAHPRENGRVSAVADWVHGKQAARIR